jgi:hypothetical protein
VTTVRLDLDGSVAGIPAVAVENAHVRAVLLPSLGGKLWQLTHVPSGRDLLWHHPRLAPRPVPSEAIYDDLFFGGWDLLFPNDEPEALSGVAMPDHGEVWSRPWQYDVEVATSDKATVHMWVDAPRSRCRLESWVTVTRGEPRVRFRHRLANEGTTALPYLLKLHAAVALTDDSRIDLATRRVLVGDWGEPRVGRTGVGYDWPYCSDETGQRHDMRLTLSPASGVTELQYATELTAGWCAITGGKDRPGLGISFDPQIFRSCWTFASYGGWQDLHVAVLEPCTGYPIGVREGLAQGTHQVLGAGETLDTEVAAIVLDGRADGERDD